MLSAPGWSVKERKAYLPLWKILWNLLWYDMWNMAKKKIRIIQVPMPEDLVAKLDAISYEVEESRSFVIREALVKYVTAREEEELDRQYAEGYRKYPEDKEELEAMARASAEALEPEDFSDWADYPGDK